MPVDVRNVDGEDGEGRVPTGTSALMPVFLLNEDIKVSGNDRGQAPFRSGTVGCLGGIPSSAIPAGIL